MLGKVEMRFYKTDSSNNNDKVKFNESHNYKSNNGNNDIEIFDCYFGDRRNYNHKNKINDYNKDSNKNYMNNRIEKFSCRFADNLNNRIDKDKRNN